MQLSIFFMCLFLFISHLSALVKGELTQILQLSEGEERLVKIELRNDLDHPQTILFKQADYNYNATGENFYDPPGSSARSNASWIKIPQERITIPPKSDVEYFYKIKVPKHLTRQGSYWSLILIEPENEKSIHPDNQPGMQIKVKVRYAHQMITNIGQSLPTLKIVNKVIEGDRDGMRLKIDAANHGERYAAPFLTLLLYDKDGELAIAKTTPHEKLLPHTSVRYHVVLEPLKPGSYSGLLLLDCGEEAIVGERLEVNVT